MASKTASKSSARQTRKNAPVLGTPANPYPTGWVTQSKAPADGSVSKFTTQTQRRTLRELVAGEFEANGTPAQGRTLARLDELGLITVAKNGSVKVTTAGRRFVDASPAPRERKAKAPVKPAAKKAKGKKVGTITTAEAAKKTGARKVKLPSTGKTASRAKASAAKVPAETAKDRRARLAAETLAS